jgi:hypothetical protein
MTEGRRTRSTLGLISAGVKAVGLVAVLGAIGLTVLATHRTEVAAPVSADATSARALAPENAADTRASLPNYLRQASQAAAELRPKQ